MTKPFTRTNNGKYKVNGQVYERVIGSRPQVWHGTVYKTSGNLTKKDLMKNKHGRIVSKSKHNTAKKENRLVKAGYITKKGKFGSIKTKKAKRGGMNHPSSSGTRTASSFAKTGGSHLTPANYYSNNK